MSVAWPIELKPVDFGYWLLDADISGGQALGGGEQFVASPGPRWGASMMLNITTNQQVLRLRALRAQTYGRTVPVKLPNFDGQRLSWPAEVFDGESTGVILSPAVRRDPMLVGTVYATPAIPAESEIIVTMALSAPSRATTIQVTLTQGRLLIAGQQFGIGERLYEIGTVTASSIAGQYILTITPPLRAAAAAGTALLFTRPVCLMRIMNISDALRELTMLRYATVNLEFVEYL